jgi:hypothetical protein
MSSSQNGRQDCWRTGKNSPMTLVSLDLTGRLPTSAMGRVHVSVISLASH